MANLFLLDKQGLVLAFLLGLAVYFFGGLEFLAIFFVFLISSVVVTKYGYHKKRELGLYEHERSWENVLSNGLVPVLVLFFPFFGFSSIGAFLGAVAAINADKFASELGVLSPDPIDLANLKKARNGKSGCISLFGTFASFVGAITIGVFAHFLFPSSIDSWKIVFIGLIGFIGSFADSIAGVFEEKGIGNKSTSNIIGSAVGAILGLAFI